MNKPKLLFLICFLIGSISIVKAQWNEVGLPYGFGEFLNSSFIDQKGNIFVDLLGDYYFSDDIGLNWNNLNFKNNNYDYYFLENMTELENGNLLLKNGDDVYIFNYNTQKFELYVKGLYPLINIDQKGNIWYKSNDPNSYGLYVTKDGGKTYQFIKSNNLQIPCDISQIQVYNDLTYIVTGCNGSYSFYQIFGSENMELKSINNISPFLFINQKTGTLFIRNKFTGIARSTDSGSSLIDLNMPFPNKDIYEVNLRSLNDGRLLLYAGSRYIFSDDDGVTWNYFSGKFPEENPLNSYYRTSFMQINSSDSTIFVSGNCEFQGVYFSEDKGDSWINNIKNIKHPFIKKIVEDKSRNIYALTCSDTSLLVSKNQGKTWEPFVINYNNKNYSTVDIGTNFNGDLFVIGKRQGFRSFDGGKTFEIFKIPYDLDFKKAAIKLYVAENGYLYLFYDDNFVSKDQGNTWTLIDFDYNFKTPLYSDTKGMLYGINIFNHEIMTYNPETNITEFPQMDKTTVIENFICYQNGIAFLIDSNNNIYISKDGLKNFEVVQKLIYKPLELFSDDNNILYIVTKENIIFSKDQGKTFLLFTSLPGVSDNFYLSPFQNLYAYRNYDNHQLYNYHVNLASGNLITGTAFIDDNKTCSLEGNENPKIWTPVELTGTEEVNLISGFNGYHYRLNEGTYSIKAIAPNVYWEACAAKTFEILPNQKDTIQLDLGLKVKIECSYLTAQVQIPILRRCVSNYIYIEYCNEGTITANNVKLNVNLSEYMSFESSSINPISQIDNNILFEIGELAPGECGKIYLKVLLSCDANIGDLICVSIELTPIESCTEIASKLSLNDKCNYVVGSFDPNDKTAFINGKPTDGKSEMNQDIEYLIRFQNTGNDTAFRITVVDIIPEGFDIKTLKPLNSSHPYTIDIDGRTVKFIFDPIMLPDSNINEPASHGFIAFKISPNKDLPYGTKLDNYADIYFDFNEAVTTNTAYLTVTQATSTTSINNNLEFNYYPNPTKSELNIQLPQFNPQIYTLKITDLLGKELLKESWKGSSYKLNLTSSIKSGIYFIHVEDDEGKKGYGKFVKN